MNKKVLIVGAGFAGATIGRILAENSINVQIIDKRNHIGGNAYDFINSNNERIHKYGPHLLHGDRNSNAIKFLSRFTDWTKYEHKVRAFLSDGRTTPLPVNRNTLEDIFRIKLENDAETLIFLENLRNRNLNPSNTDEFFLSKVGEELTNLFFRPYTKKMWGIDPTKLEVNVGARLPVRLNRDDRYFSDNFQFLPKNGYKNLFDNMLNHENIKVSLNTIFDKSMEKYYSHCFLSIPVDNYFNYIFGQLPYRSLIFEERIHKNKNLSAPTINFTDNSKYTRMTQWDLLSNSPNRESNIHTVTYEIPVEVSKNKGEYYYPVKTRISNKIYKQYERLASNLENVTFCGRTGLFRYLDMVPAVSIHLQIANQFLKKLKVK